MVRKKIRGLGVSSAWFWLALVTCACGDDGETRPDTTLDASDLSNESDVSSVDNGASASATNATHSEGSSAVTRSGVTEARTTSSAETNATAIDATSMSDGAILHDASLPDAGPTGTEAGPGVVEVAASTAVDAGISDVADVGPNDGDAGANHFATLLELNQASCLFYQRCESRLFTYYGGEEECVNALNINTFALSGGELMPETIVPGVDVDCLWEVAALPCATVDGRDTGVFDQLQYATSGFMTCDADVEGLGCKDIDQCGEGYLCSAQGGECGECVVRQPEDGCASMLDCPVGEECIGNVCTPRKVGGEECESWMECVSARCTDGVCSPAAPVGTPCEDESECDPYLWCSDGECRSSVGEGAACDRLETYSCQDGFRCVAGFCERYVRADAPIGGVCKWDANCGAGGECSGSVCVESSDACTADNHCAEGEYCDEVCLPLLDDSESCGTDHECKSHICSQGICLGVEACR